MHLGEIHQTGTPAELRDSLGMRRIEVHTGQSGQAEERLTRAQRTGDIGDVQRFGDRLDVIVRDPAAAALLVEATLAKAGITVRDIRWPIRPSRILSWRRCAPSVRNCTRRLFPAVTRTQPGREVAIGGQNLTKRFGAFTAVNNVNVQVRYGEVYGCWELTARARPPPSKCCAVCWTPTTGRPSLPASSEHPIGSVRQLRRLHVPEVLALRRFEHRGEPGFLRRRLRRAGGRARGEEAMGAGILRPRRQTGTDYR